MDEDMNLSLACVCVWACVGVCVCVCVRVCVCVKAHVQTCPDYICKKQGATGPSGWRWSTKIPLGSPCKLTCCLHPHCAWGRRAS